MAAWSLLSLSALVAPLENGGGAAVRRASRTGATRSPMHLSCTAMNSSGCPAGGTAVGSHEGADGCRREPVNRTRSTTWANEVAGAWAWVTSWGDPHARRYVAEAVANALCGSTWVARRCNLATAVPSRGLQDERLTPRRLNVCRGRSQECSQRATSRRLRVGGAWRGE
jgi:hypothetical protein